MKKKVIIIFSLCMVCSVLFGQEMKQYHDWNNGYHGYSRAMYRGTIKVVNPQILYDILIENVKPAFRSARKCLKLSKQEIFLIDAALKEYDCRDGEVYSLEIINGRELEILQIVIVISNDGKNYSWYGGDYMVLRWR